jgi:alpha-beta hydrolase superfamily lysophospholipase
MSRPLAAGLLFCGALGSIFLTFQTSYGQGEKDGTFKEAKFDTVDQVELKGSYYPSAAGKDAPCVLLLHKLMTGKKERWDKLAAALQKKGYAVLTFDFRGHGESTSVSPEFWKFPHNQKGVAGYKVGESKSTINHQDFRAADYALWLVNDIAAAKSYLDRRNDEGLCNSANLIVMGEDDGATLGAMWLASEFNRYRAVSLIPIKTDGSSEGKKVAAAVWLSMSPRISSGRAGSVPANLTTWLRDSHKVPMAFLYGEADSQGENLAKSYVKLLRSSGARNPDKNIEKLTDSKAVKGGAKLQGADLLKETLGTDQLIINYLETLKNEKKLSNEYEKRDFDSNNYVWKFGNAKPVIAKQEKEKFLNFIPINLLQK